MAKEHTVTVRVGINGFGRIGRNFFRAVQAQNRDGSADIEIVAVNDLTDINTLAHLLKFDSILGRLPQDVSLEGDDTIVIGDTKIKALEVKEGPAALPWGDLGVDVVGIGTVGRLGVVRRGRFAGVGGAGRIFRVVFGHRSPEGASTFQGRQKPRGSGGPTLQLMGRMPMARGGTRKR